MALVKFGAGVVDMRGSIGGTIFSKNAGGQYARARVAPVNPNSSRQATIRAAIALLAQIWHNTLTPQERTAWGLYAANINIQNRLGETILISGYNHFVRSNTPRINVGLARIDAGPTNLTLPEGDPQFQVTTSVAGQSISVAFDDTRDWASESGAAMIVSMSQPAHSAVNFIGKPFRVIDTINFESCAAATSPAVLGTLPYVISADQVVGFKARITRVDGRLSEFFRDPRVPTE